MANYTKTTNFATKDSLSSGDPAKKIKGTEFNTEFDAIATAVATKADLASPALTGTPTAPTASSGTNTTQIATTAFVASAVSAAGGGTVTSVGVSSSDLTVTGSPVTSSGTIALALNTVPVAKGGTGQTSYTDGQLLIGNSSGNTLTKAILTAGTGVSITNGNGSITIAATGTAGVATISGGTTGLTPATATSGDVTLGGTLAVANGGTGATSFTSGSLLKGAGTGAIAVASASDIVTAIGSTAVTNASNVAITNDTTTNATVYPTWVTTTTGNLPSKTSSSKLSFNPSTGVLTSTSFSGSGASLTSLSAANISAGTLAVARGGTGVTAQPIFSAYADTTLSITAGTATKVRCNIEDFDPDSCYNTTTYRFTPTTAGYYQVNAVIRFNPGASSVGTNGFIAELYKNGAVAFRGDEIQTKDAGYGMASLNAIVYLNGSTDYIELFGTATVGSGGSPLFYYDSSALTSRFQAHFIRA